MGSLRSSRIDLRQQGVLAEEQVDGLFAVARDGDIVGDVGAFERADGQEFVVGIVFDQENAACLLQSYGLPRTILM